MPVCCLARRACHSTSLIQARTNSTVQASMHACMSSNQSSLMQALPSNFSPSYHSSPSNRSSPSTHHHPLITIQASPSYHPNYHPPHHHTTQHPLSLTADHNSDSADPAPAPSTNPPAPPTAYPPYSKSHHAHSYSGHDTSHRPSSPSYRICPHQKTNCISIDSSNIKQTITNKHNSQPSKE